MASVRTEASRRNHSLDAARGILMMLGVVLHASNIYATAATWIVSDPQRNFAFDVISRLIHVFRMPAFFWISGYFVGLTFEKMGAEAMVRRRFLRLAVPLVTTWLTLNVIQEYFLAARAGSDPVAAIVDGVPIGHLWFLLDLLVYTAVSALILPRLAGRRPTASPAQLRGHWTVQLTIFAIACYAATFIVRLSGAAYVHMFDMPDLYRLATFGPFFAIGLAMYRSPEMEATFLRTPAASVLVALPLALAATRFQHNHNPLIREAAGLVIVFSTWVSVAGLLAIFHRVFREESPVTRFLSDASYSVYLFHHLIVVVLGSALIACDIGPWPKFIVICVITLLLTSAIHVHVVRRVRWVRLLFNGKT